MSIRVLDDQDLSRTIPFADASNQMMDGVGLIAFSPDPAKKRDLAREVPTHLQLDRTLAWVCTALRQLP